MYLLWSQTWFPSDSRMIPNWFQNSRMIPNFRGEYSFCWLQHNSKKQLFALFSRWCCVFGLLVFRTPKTLFFGLWVFRTPKTLFLGSGFSGLQKRSRDTGKRQTIPQSLSLSVAQALSRSVAQALSLSAYCMQKCWLLVCSKSLTWSVHAKNAGPKNLGIQNLEELGGRAKAMLRSSCGPCSTFCGRFVVLCSTPCGPRLWSNLWSGGKFKP